VGLAMFAGILLFDCGQWIFTLLLDFNGFIYAVFWILLGCSLLSGFYALWNIIYLLLKVQTGKGYLPITIFGII